jgi:hypothetical protein
MLDPVRALTVAEDREGAQARRCASLCEREQAPGAASRGTVRIGERSHGRSSRASAGEGGRLNWAAGGGGR